MNYLKLIKSRFIMKKNATPSLRTIHIYFKEKISMQKYHYKTKHKNQQLNFNSQTRTILGAKFNFIEPLQLTQKTLIYSRIFFTTLLKEKRGVVITPLA